MRVPILHPRNGLDPVFRRIGGRHLWVMDTASGAGTARGGGGGDSNISMRVAEGGHANEMAGLAGELGRPAVQRARGDLPALGGGVQYEADELLPLGETLHLLQFAGAGGRRYQPDEEGRRSSPPTRRTRAPVAAALLAYVPLLKMIRQVSDERWNHRASAVRFRDELEDTMSRTMPGHAAHRHRLGSITPKLFSYDEEAEQFSLEDTMRCCQLSE